MFLLCIVCPRFLYLYMFIRWMFCRRFIAMHVSGTCSGTFTRNCFDSSWNRIGYGYLFAHILRKIYIALIDSLVTVLFWQIFGYFSVHFCLFVLICIFFTSVQWAIFNSSIVHVFLVRFFLNININRHSTEASSDVISIDELD